MTKLCSACLLGAKCRYDGRSKANKKIIELSKKETLIPVCPEHLSGLPTPRESAGIHGGTGNDVLEGKATVRTVKYGKDLTENFVKGANAVLQIAKCMNINEVILKQKSPSCGCGKTWQLDDSFTNHIVDGDGVTVALLKKNGIKVIPEDVF